VSDSGVQVIRCAGRIEKSLQGRAKMNCYVHSVPGRLRVKTPTVKRNRAAARQVEGLMNQLRGINLTTANTTTGSVLVVYDPKAISTDLILNTLENEGHFDNSGVVSCDQYIGQAASKAGRLLGKVLFGAFVERAFQGSALSYLAALI
jgi:hypothetical protein